MKRREESRWSLRMRNLLLLLFFVAGTLFGSGLTASAEVPKPVTDGVGLITYTWKAGSVTVYKDSGRKEEYETVKEDSLAITVKKFENNNYYCTYKVGSVRHKGWIPRKTLLAQPTAAKNDALLRYSVTAYSRPNGKNLGKIPSYTDVDIVGKKGGWYQIVYKYKKNYWMAWITASEYTSAIRIFDGSEKRLMSEGVYTMALAPNQKTMITVRRSTTLVTANARKFPSQRFEFRFTGQNCYQIFHNGTNLCMTAETEDGSYTGNVVLQEAGGDAEAGQIWQLIRKGAYYYLKNKGTSRFLTGGETYTTKKYSASLPQKFRIVMTGKNMDHWQVFSQYDSEWGGLKYGRTNTMAGSACGVLSSVNAVYALNGQYMDPMEVAAYAVKTGYRVEGSGTDYRFVQAAAKHFGLKYGYAFAGSTYSLSTFTKHLQSGGTAVVYVPHHYICVADYKDGKYLVLDPYATAARKTSPFGCWVSGSRFQSGTLRSQNYLLLKATD